MYFFSIWGDGIDFVDKYDCGALFLSLLESFTKVTLCLTSHFWHNLWTVDQEEKGTSFVSYCSCNQSLPWTRWSIKKNSSWWLDSQSFKELRVSQWKFYHLSNQCHLFSASSNIIVSDFIKFLLVLSIDWLSFSIKHCIWGHDTILFWLCCHYFKLDWFEISSYNKQVTLFNRSICILEIWYKECFSEITCNSFDSILNW